MSDFPHSLIEFQSRFPDEAACVRYLFTARWPEGFVCPACGAGKAWSLQTKAWTWECAPCGRQTSVTAGTIMHHTKLPLTLWFWAAYLMATHSNAPCCMDRRCGRTEPDPCSGSCGADILGASEVQHSVQHVGGDRHLGCLSPVGREA